MEDKSDSGRWCSASESTQWGVCGREELISVSTGASCDLNCCPQVALYPHLPLRAWVYYMRQCPQAKPRYFNLNIISLKLTGSSLGTSLRACGGNAYQEIKMQSNCRMLVVAWLGRSCNYVTSHCHTVSYLTWQRFEIPVTTQGAVHSCPTTLLPQGP